MVSARIELLPPLEDARVDLLDALSRAALATVRRLPQHLRRDAPVDLLSGHVADHEDQVESREQGVRQPNVLGQGHARIEASVDRVRGRHDSAPGVQRHVHAGLVDGDALLLHGLVDRHAVGEGHLVELIDADEVPVREDHGAGLKGEVLRPGLADHRRRKANATGATARCADGAGREVHDEAKHLRLATGRVANQQHVDVAAEVRAVGQVLLRAADHLQEHTSLDALVAADGRREGACEQVEGVLPRGDVLDVPHVRADEGLLQQLRERLDVGGDEPSRPDTIGEVLRR
mmetsp:Transcript_22485/g.57301  ORF Transcript_22485/g.57301 Transcript_22485/m.57301 type:complete len:290 (+) Transcript_22485:1028-1897(+)